MPTFRIALEQIRTWSQAHPDHVPIMILIELKDERIKALPTRPVAFDREQIDAVDREILAVFPRQEILTPDGVRGNHNSLPEALHQNGWPRLAECRGLVLFALDNEGPIRDRYLQNHSALAGRIMFASVDPNHAAAAWFKINDPVGDFARIQRLVRQGFLVRTRADADTRQARTGNVTQREKAFASGAQFISTDYPAPDPRFTTYAVRFEQGQVARTNPVNGDPSLRGLDLESLEPNSRP